MLPVSGGQQPALSRSHQQVSAAGSADPLSACSLMGEVLFPPSPNW